MNKNLIYIGVIIILSIGTILPLFYNNFFKFHDNTQVERVYEMGRMLSQRTFPVRWVPDLGYGYGYPIFNFYGPLPYYVGGFISILGFDVLVSTKIMISIAMISSSIAMYFLGRKFFGELGGLMSSVVYSYFPYHAINLYVRGAINELYAYAIFPVILLGLLNLYGAKKFSMSSYVLIAFGVFLLAISHNISFIMTAVILTPLFIILFALTSHKKQFIFYSIPPLLLGLFMASFYLIPAFFEMKFTNVSSQIGGGANFYDHFVCVSQYWNSFWGFGGSVKGCLDGMSFEIGKITIGTLLIATAFIIHNFINKKNLKSVKYILIVYPLLFFSFIMTLSFSTKIWEIIPFSAYIQYPWRFINFISLFSAFIIGFIPFYLKNLFGLKISSFATFALIVLFIILNIKFFNPQSATYYPPSYYINSNHLKFMVSKISDEYLPYDFKKPTEIKDLPLKTADIISGNGWIDFDQIKLDKFKINYNADSELKIHINKSYFPSWKARLEGKNLPIKKDNRGFNFKAPQGRGTITVEFKNTNIQKLSNAVSLITILSFLISIIILLRHKFYYGKKTT